MDEFHSPRLNDLIRAIRGSILIFPNALNVIGGSLNQILQRFYKILREPFAVAKG